MKTTKCVSCLVSRVSCFRTRGRQTPRALSAALSPRNCQLPSPDSTRQCRTDPTPVSFASLPMDMLVDIAQYLSPNDALAIRSTNRALLSVRFSFLLPSRAGWMRNCTDVLRPTLWRTQIFTPLAFRKAVIFDLPSGQRLESTALSELSSLVKCVSNTRSFRYGSSPPDTPALRSITSTDCWLGKEIYWSTLRAAIDLLPSLHTFTQRANPAQPPWLYKIPACFIDSALQHSSGLVRRKTRVHLRCAARSPTSRV